MPAEQTAPIIVVLKNEQHKKNSAIEVKERSVVGLEG